MAAALIRHFAHEALAEVLFERGGPAGQLHRRLRMTVAKPIPQAATRGRGAASQLAPSKCNFYRASFRVVTYM